MIELKKGLQHGSCVDFNGKGLLILGDPRSGKSSLALACMSIGAILVGDDYIVLNTCDNKIIANNPPNISGKIEVSRVGILNCDFIKKTKIDLKIYYDVKIILLSLLSAIAVILFFYSYTVLQVYKVNLISNFHPIGGMVIAIILFKEHLSRYQILGAISSIIACVLIYII